MFDTLEEEVLHYKLAPNSEMPSVPRESGKPTKGEELFVYWQQVGKMKTLTGTARFPYLTCLTKCILALLQYLYPVLTLIEYSAL